MRLHRRTANYHENIPEFCARGYLVLGGGGYWEDTIQRRMNMTLQDGDLLQGLIIFGGCGGFDGYITLGGIST